MNRGPWRALATITAAMLAAACGSSGTDASAPTAPGDFEQVRREARGQTVNLTT